MNLDAPQLVKVDWSVATDGSLAQFQLNDTAGTAFKFRVSYRQLEFLIEPIRHAAREMHRRLIANKEAAKAEIVASLQEPMMVSMVIGGNDKATGELVLTFEMDEGGLVSMRFPSAQRAQLQTSLGNPQRRCGELVSGRSRAA